MGLSASRPKGSGGGRRTGSVQRRKSGSVRPEVRASARHSYSRQGVSQAQRGSTLNPKNSSSKKAKCACCDQKFNIFDSLRKLYPPRRCARCSRDVCKKCYNNKCCHKCSTKERDDIKTLTKLEEMDRKQLVGILKELHCGTKDAELIGETSNLILTILKQCDMDANFVKDFENSVSKRTTPQVTESVIHNQHLVHDKSFTESDISKKTDIIVGKNKNVNILKANPYDNGQPRFVDMFNQQQQLNISKDSSFDLPPPPPLPLDTTDDTFRSTPNTSRVPTPMPNESFQSLKVEDQLVNIDNDEGKLKPQLELNETDNEIASAGLATPMATHVTKQETQLVTKESQILIAQPNVLKAELKVITVEAIVLPVKSKVPSPAIDLEVPVIVSKLPTMESTVPVSVTKSPDLNTKVTETKDLVIESMVPVTETKTPVLESKVLGSQSQIPITETKILVLETKNPVGDSKVTGTESKIKAIVSKVPQAGSNVPILESKSPVLQSKIPVTEGKAPVLKSKIPTMESKIIAAELKTQAVEAKPSILKSKIPVKESSKNSRTDAVSIGIEPKEPGELPPTPMINRTSANDIGLINSDRLQLMSTSEPVINRCKSIDSVGSSSSRPSSIVMEGSSGLRPMSLIEKRRSEPLRTSTPRISRAQSLRSLPSAKAIEEFDMKRLKEIMERALENVSQQELATIVTNLWLIRRKMKPREQNVQVAMIGSLGEIATSDVISKLSVVQIKRILGQHQVSFQDCQEKFEMVQKLTQLWNDSNRGGRDSDEIPQGDACVICLSQRANCVFLDCCHLVTCDHCSTSVKECPICRHFIVKVLRVFRA